MGRIVLDGVVAGYGFGDVLRGLDLEVEPECITCLIGPNGAGKSTVLRAISGLIRPSKGSIRLGDRQISGLDPGEVLGLGVVHVPQERSLFPLMSVWENVLMGAYVVKDRKEVRRRAEAVAERFPIVAQRRTERAGSLSGGEQKLVELARALMLEPTVLLVDEPSIGLAPRARRQVFETLVSLSEAGWTILLVEQNARSGLAISHHGAVLDGGVVKLTGSGADLLSDPRVAELYLGGRVKTGEANQARREQHANSQAAPHPSTALTASDKRPTTRD
jgi:branched-chain amino acid transport system ATP-binding protein